MTRKVLALVLLATTLGAAPPAARPTAVPRSMPALMSEMLHYYAALRTDLEDPAKLQDAYFDLAIVQRDTVLSKMMTPSSISKLPAGEQADARDSYRALMNSLLTTLLDMEDAIKEKKPEEIKKLFAKIEMIMGQGHMEFVPATK